MKTFEGENFHKFQDFVALRKSFVAKFGGVPSFGTTSKQSVKVLHENLTFHQFTKAFSCETFPLYTICAIQFLQQHFLPLSPSTHTAMIVTTLQRSSTITTLVLRTLLPYKCPSLPHHQSNKSVIPLILQYISLYTYYIIY